MQCLMLFFATACLEGNCKCPVVDTWKRHFASIYLLMTR